MAEGSHVSINDISLKLHEASLKHLLLTRLSFIFFPLIFSCILFIFCKAFISYLGLSVLGQLTQPQNRLFL